MGMSEDPSGLWLFLALVGAAFAYIEVTRAKPEAKKEEAPAPKGA